MFISGNAFSKAKQEDPWLTNGSSECQVMMTACTINKADVEKQEEEERRKRKSLGE